MTHEASGWAAEDQAALAMADSLDAFYEQLERVLVPSICDWFKLYVVRPDGSPELVAAVHRDADLTTSILERAQAYPPSASDAVGVGAALRTGEPELIEDIPAALLPALCQDAAHLEFTRAIGLRSSLIVPIKHEQTVIAVLRLVQGASARYFCHADLEAAQALALNIAEVLSRLLLEYSSQRELEVERRERRIQQVAHLRYKAILEANPVSTQVLSNDGRTLEVNRAWEDFWGIRVEDDPSYHMSLFENTQLRETGVLQFFERALNGETLAGPPTLYDTSQHTEGGQARWIRVLAKPVVGASGRVREIVVAHQELGDLEVKAATSRLEQLGYRVPQHLRGHLAYRDNLLSPRERAVLHLVAEGQSNKQIAKVLGISENTAKFHVTGLFNKLGVNSRAMAVSAAVQNGLL
jgi:DNA-binding CsgD family transcriptional regulator/PAS domain-containing protein